MAVCPECGRQNPEDARFCSGCGEALAAPRPERRKLVTLLFCDVAASTALGEHADAETVREIMGRYFEQARETIERHGGTVEKFVGDAVMAVFGVPVAHEDDAIRAVRAAADIQAGVGELNTELETRFGRRLAVRIGVNTGEVVAAGGARQMIVTGDAVNVAARLEQHARPGETLVGEATYRLVRGQVEAEPVEPLAAKGKSEPIPARRLVAVRSAPATRPTRPDVPIVGRQEELAVLRRSFDEVVAKRHARLIVVAGEPGVGKSRLITELLASIAADATILRGRCLSYGEGITYWPLREVLEDAAAILDTDSVDEALDRLARLLGPDERGRTAAAALAQALGLTAGSVSADDIAWAARELFETLARERPLVVHLDDLHWAEPTFLDLVERAVSLSPGSPILLLGVASPELLDERPEWPSLRIEPLDPGESNELVERLLGHAAMPEDARRRAIESSEGNPLFVEELVSMLLEDPDLEAPTSLDALLGARLDRLPEGERSAAERGAVEGQEFHVGSAEELSDEPETVAPALAALTAKDLVRPAEPRVADEIAFRFRHLLIRDAAYRGIPKRLRAALHCRYARWLERAVVGRVAEHAELLGYHLEQSYRYSAELELVDDETRAIGAEAAEWLSFAAGRAFVRGDMRAAANLLGRAVRLLEHDAAARLELLPELARALRFSGDPPAAEAVLREATGSTAVADARLEARVSVESAFLRLYTDADADADAMIRTAEEAGAAFAETGDELGLAKSWSLIGYVNWHLCRGAAMQDAFERALSHLQRSGDLRERWWILTKLLDAAIFGPVPAEQGIRRCNELLAVGDGVRSLETSATLAIASLEAMRGNFGAAREGYAQSREIAEELGLTQWLASLGNYIGPIELLAGDPAAAERALRQGYETLESLGETGVLSTTAANLSRAVVLQGRFDEAERHAAVSRRSASRDDLYSQVVWRGTSARILLHRGELGAAEAVAREGVDLAATTDFLNLHGESLLDLAEVLWARGQDAEAAEVTGAAVGLFDAKGCTALAERARLGLTSHRGAL